MPPPKREGCARRFPPLYFSMGALLDFCRCFLSTREGQTSGAWELLQVFVFCNIPVLVARYRTSCEKMFPRLSFSVYRTARGRSELIPCITLKNHLTRFKLFFIRVLRPRSKVLGGAQSHRRAGPRLRPAIRSRLRGEGFRFLASARRQARKSTASFVRY